MKHNLLMALVFLLPKLILSQVTIGSAVINEFNIRPAQLFNVTVVSSNTSGTAILKAKVINSSGTPILSAETQVISIKPGANIINANTVSLKNYNYSNINQAQYLKTNGRLSSGLYNVCIDLIPVSGIEDGDEYCQEINSSENEFLDLVFPADFDTIETKKPVLTWTHSEAFNLLAEGEFYKMTLVEKKKDQSAEAAVQSNIPLFVKSYLTSHQIPYAFDAKELEEGKTYAWYVQKISNGMVINRTESWEFTLKKNITPKPHKYVELKSKLDGSFYSVVDDYIYFKLNENYKNAEVQVKIKSDKGEYITPDLTNEQKGEQVLGRGYNTFELDLSPYNLKKGYYTLIVTGVKGKKYQLKFYVG